MQDKPTTEEELHDWSRRLVEDGRARRRANEAQWWTNIATYNGDFWTEFNIRDKRLTEPPKPDHKVRIPINLAQPVIRTEYAKLVKNKPIVDCVARSNDKTDLNAADVGDKLLNNYCEQEFHLPRVRRRALMWVLLTGSGGVFTDYDDSLNGFIEVDVNEAGVPIIDERDATATRAFWHKKKQAPKKQRIPQGDLVVSAVSPFEVLWDYSKIFFDDARWCIVSQVMDVTEVERRWGVEVEREEVTPGTIEQRLLAKFDLTNKLSMEAPDAQDLCEVHRLFVRPNHPYFPDGAEIIFTNNKMIQISDTYPFQHAELPVAWMGHVPFPVSQYAGSILQQLRPVVLELSKTESQMIENRNLMANPPWMIPETAAVDEEIVNKPGLRITYRFMPNVPEPHPIEMPDMPNYVQNFIPVLREHILEISGQGETSQGRVPSGARSGVAIAYLQEEDDTKLGPTVQEFEEMIQIMAGQMLSVIAEKYDTPRTIQIYRKHSEPEVFDFEGSQLEGVATVIVQAGSALPRSKAAKQQYILDLWDRGLEQDPRKVREMLELSQGDPDEWEIDLQQAERENRKMMEAEDVPVEEWYNHPAHHYVHRRFMKSADFEAMDEQTQQIFKDHDEMHSRVEQEQQMTAQFMQQGGPNGGGAQPSPQQGQVANGQNNGGPQPPFASSGDLGSLVDAQPQ